MKNEKSISKSKPTPKAKEQIKIKFKKLANGNQSIFLEKYEGYKITGTLKDGTSKTSAIRSFEFLNMYLIPETNPTAKAKNKDTLNLANTIKSMRLVDLQTKNIGFPAKKLTKVNLIEYVEGIGAKALLDTKNKRSEYYTFKSLAYHLKIYKGKNLYINDIDKNYINGFIEYLKTAKNGNFDGQENQPIISQNTAHKLFAKFTTVLKKAMQNEIISTNPMLFIDDKSKPKTQPSKREYLTLEEIKKLIETDCKRPEIKKAFLFCCLVGIRFENVRNIIWNDIVSDKNGTVLSYKQIKTNTFENLHISNEALKFLPARATKNGTDKIFELPKNETVNGVLEKWGEAAEIHKKITFHVSRHTAATLQLSLGTPIETVSKLLGHSKISTTQIYAKIIDKNKVEAVNLQNGIFD